MKAAKREVRTAGLPTEPVYDNYEPRPEEKEFLGRLARFKSSDFIGEEASVQVKAIISGGTTSFSDAVPSNEQHFLEVQARLCGFDLYKHRVRRR